jgi:hypothetical protein
MASDLIRVRHAEWDCHFDALAAHAAVRGFTSSTSRGRCYLRVFRWRNGHRTSVLAREVVLPGIDAHTELPDPPHSHMNTRRSQKLHPRLRGRQGPCFAVLDVRRCAVRQSRVRFSHFLWGPEEGGGWHERAPRTSRVHRIVARPGHHRHHCLWGRRGHRSGPMLLILCVKLAKFFTVLKCFVSRKLRVSIPRLFCLCRKISDQPRSLLGF